ncbi:MAG TPA: AGE family epimerase/isomerase [Gemmatimonadales bacterium]|nr:AGE family epimerase/isomerase [Gemmatimonadales bacterium]
MDAWYPRAIDREYGGFLSPFDYRWKPTGDQDKMIVTQARQVSMTARAAQLFPRDTMYSRAAAQGVRSLRERMWDARNGAFFWLVTREGRPKPGRGQP